MGTLEKSAKRERRWGEFQKTLLSAVGIGDVVVNEEDLPNPVRLLRHFSDYKNGARFNYQSKTAFGRLVDKGLIVFVEERGKRYARITEKGKRVLHMEMERVAVKKKRKWDSRWRVVIFDVPEKRKSVRAILRRFMGQYGFVRLQDSVWIYPHDCEDLIALAKANFRIGADVLYMIVERLEHDKHLREHFSLPPE